MPEIRLGSIENMRNINLGGIELQEVYLGTHLVWQNNQGPVFVSLSWDGTAFSVPQPYEGVMVTANSIPTLQSGNRTINIVVGNISDPDNAEMPTDFIVGYRLRRPDGSYAAGDPMSSANRSDGAPIGEYGDILPGTSSTYDSANDIFTAGARTDASSTISVQLRDIDNTGTAAAPSTTVVDSTTQEFADDGVWVLTIVDSRGGDSDEANMDITLNYTAPASNASISSGGSGGNGTTFTVTNSTIGGPSTITLTANPIGSAGPISTGTEAQTYTWTCVSGCSGGPFNARTTAALPVPQSASGGATPSRWSVTTTGRAWNGNNALTNTITVGFRSGPSCRPGFTVSTSSFSFFSDPSNTGVCNPLVGAPASPSVTCSGDCSGFSYSSGTRFNAPSPGCPSGTSTPNTATVSVSGTTTGLALSASGSRGFSGSFPGAASTCRVTINCENVVSSDPRCNTTQTVSIGCTGSTCDGAPAVAPCNTPVLGISGNSDYTANESCTQCSGPGGTSTCSVTGSAIRGACGLSCVSTTVQVGSAPSCTANPSTNGVSVTQNNLGVTGVQTCTTAGTSFVVSLTGTVRYGNGSVCGPDTGTSNRGNPRSITINCVAAPPPAPSFDTGNCTFTCSEGSLSGGGATLSPGQSGTRTCVSGGLTSSSTSGTCPAAATGHRLILRAPSGAACDPTDTQRWSWMCNGNSRSAVLRVGDSNFSGCIDPDGIATSTFRSNFNCFGSFSRDNTIDCTC